MNNLIIYLVIYGLEKIVLNIFRAELCFNLNVANRLNNSVS